MVARHLGVEALELPAELAGGSNGAQGIVLVDGRHAEDRHDRVADKLLDRATVALDELPGGGKRAAEHVPHGLRIQALAELRGAGDVGKQDCDGPACLARAAGDIVDQAGTATPTKRNPSGLAPPHDPHVAIGGSSAKRPPRL